MSSNRVKAFSYSNVGQFSLHLRLPEIRKVFLKVPVQVGRIVAFDGGFQLAEKRDGQHADEAAQPDGQDCLVGVTQRLPGQRAQRMADCIVALY